MATATYFNRYTLDLASGLHDWTADTFTWVLLNAANAPVATDSFGDLTEITPGNGYTTGGNTIDNVGAATATTNDCAITYDDEVIVASGGSIGPFRYFALVNTTSSMPVLFVDRGSDVTLADTEQLTVDVAAVPQTITA